jgi:hypothetical protein
MGDGVQVGRRAERQVPVAVLAAALLFNLGQGMLRPTLPLYLQQVFAANYQMVTLIPLVFGVGKWAASLPTGYLLDRVERRCGGSFYVVPLGGGTPDGDGVAVPSAGIASTPSRSTGGDSTANNAWMSASTGAGVGGCLWLSHAGVSFEMIEPCCIANVPRGYVAWEGSLCVLISWPLAPILMTQRFGVGGFSSS